MKRCLLLLFLVVLTPLAAEITADSVAVEPEGLERVKIFVRENSYLIATFISLLFALFEIVRERKSWRASLALLAQTLQDENKMENGKYFTSATVEKMEEIAKLTGARKVEVETAKEVLSKVNKKGIQVGSYRGKPVYLQDALVVGGMLRNAWRVLRR